jgi:methanogenic corrinoid protein MtbC1
VLSIGALSAATGLPVETLRTWERRYGFPTPVERTGAAHRRYPLETVERLKLAGRAMDLGHKPSIALRASMSTLRDLLAVSGAPEPKRTTLAPAPTGGSFVERCIQSVARLDSEPLVQELERAWNELGAMTFLTTAVAPLLSSIGEAWGRKELEVGHEHFASEIIREFLSARWRPMSERSQGPRVVCGTLEREHHVLGLHMAAVVLSLAGARIVFLGGGTPVRQLVESAVETRSRAVLLSAAEGTDRRRLERQVKALLQALPAGTSLVVGGRGFEPPPRGVRAPGGLLELEKWALTLFKSGS